MSSQEITYRTIFPGEVLKSGDEVGTKTSLNGHITGARWVEICPDNVGQICSRFGPAHRRQVLGESQ